MKITIIGLGLMGGSIAAGLKRHDQTIDVTAYDQNLVTLNKALQCGLIDRHATTIEEASKMSEIIVIATPLGTYEKIFIELAACLHNQQIVTDVGSVKGSVMTIAEKILGKNLPYFVPAHPIAGSEQSGVATANGNLFTNSTVILTPLTITNNYAITKVNSLWHLLGARTVTMSADRHDDILAYTSHLPHLLAYTMVDIFCKPEQSKKLQYTANGFSSIARLAKSNPEVWRDITAANSKAVLQAISIFNERLSRLEKNIIDENFTAIYETFNATKKLLTKERENGQ